jgi:hypothetical protein
VIQGDNFNTLSHDEARAKAARMMVIEYLQILPRNQALAICSAFLDEAGAGAADFSHEDAAAGGAEYWADFAAPHELRAYAKATLSRLQAQVPVYGERTRKALLVDLWKTLSPQDRARFLQSVDPSGEFIGKGKA